MAKRPYFLKVGPPMDQVSAKDFTRLRESFGKEPYLPDIWKIIGPTVEYNMRGRQSCEQWQLYCICYLQGLENASSSIWRNRIGFDD